MFTNAQIEVFTQHLNEVKDDLLSNKKETADEAWWSTPYYVNAEDYAFEERYDIFNGNCGIALFFLEFYRFDKNEAHLHLIDKMMNRILRSAAVLKPKFFALYTGIGGVIYTNLKVFEVTGNQKYLDSALQLTLDNQMQLSETLSKADLLSGYTGNLLAFTLLYHHSQHKQVKKLISVLLDRVVNEVRVSQIGLKWDYNASKKAYDGMTGFSHGASGIAYVLMQLSVYFDAPGLLYLSEEALAYEMQYYYTPAKNWLDLRIGNYHMAKPQAHLWQLETFISDMAGVNAWAHGAAGVGLSRSMAFELTQNEIYSKQCNDVLEKCLSDLLKPGRPDFTLVSGYLGMIPFLARYKDKEGIADQISMVVDGAIKQYQKTNSYSEYLSCGPHDYGLFSGKAGAGYMLLQLLSGDQFASVAQPKLPIPKKITNLNGRFSAHQIKKQIFSSYYRRTIQKIEGANINLSTIYKVENIDKFSRALSSQINQIAENREEIRRSFELESEILKLWKFHKGYFSYQQRNIYLNNIAEEANLKSDGDLIALTLKLNDHVKYYGDNVNGGGLLLICNEQGVEEKQIGVFPAVIIKLLGTKDSKILVLVAKIAKAYFDSNASKELITQKILQQIRLLLKSGFVSCK
ncbi:lanthionine synthetase LanC family protein [Pedobacter sp. CFBP9032]|uniref:lanthionine synthetase LanC family protein n=1 Tax=Pedobacter sp. CFBP9032 TaxID=3096539 RepID=UPI002A6AB009|nr:lanthionine synthetase LanC family protein [Pedobacter sp. CFBP9032]MDY0904928.1 lanthionine synthetase LanC family protein [Pedobacter sp. CFBP9032]